MAESRYYFLQGLIHISELSWNKIFTPEAVVQPGMIVRCKVMSADSRAGKINLSLRVSSAVDKAEWMSESVLAIQLGLVLASPPATKMQ